jgi:ABC-type sugar transport system substrate-binding protein
MPGDAVYELGSFHSIGDVAAEQTAKFVGTKNGQVVLVTWDLGTYKSPAVEAIISAFKKTAKKEGLILAGIELVKPLPRTETTFITNDYFANILNKYPGADALVLLTGPPVLSDEQIRALPERLPKCVVMTWGLPMSVGRLLRSGVVQAAIVQRDMVVPSAVPSPTNHNEFDQQYCLVTSAASLSIE